MQRLTYTGTNYDEVKRLCEIVATVSKQSLKIVFRQKFNLSRLFWSPKRVSIRSRMSRTASWLLMVSSSVAVTRFLSGFSDSCINRYVNFAFAI